MKKLIFFTLTLFFFYGCVGHMSYNAGQVHCSWFKFSDGPGTCTVFDPILKQQVPVSESSGIKTVCTTKFQPCTVDLFEKTICRVCQATYTDSMGNTFKGESFNISAEYCKQNPDVIVCL